MSYHHLNTLTIFPDRLAHNFYILSQFSHSVKPVPVLKSNAYGHGIKIVAKLLNKYDVPFVCVDSLYEAYELVKYGCKKKILIMGFVDPQDVPRNKQFMYAVSDILYAHKLIRRYGKIQLHLFLDTGMRREGLMNLEGIEEISTHIVGVMSHLATPDNVDFSNSQIAEFSNQLKNLKEQGITPKYVHILASGGLINISKYSSTEFSNESETLARTGIAWYGYGHPDLLPALRCTTHVVQVKDVRIGDRIGYDGTFAASKPMKIAVLPMGYHDGMDRRFSNIGCVMIDGTLCPIVGRVSMNITTIDVSNLVEVSIGQEVVFVDENPDSPVSLERQAERAGMIPYDFLVHLSKEMYREGG